jgi:CheY-like chemotaxis protein
MKKIEPKRGLAPHGAPTPARHRELLLYVEDDDDNWRVADVRLRENYEIMRATNAREACQVLMTRGNELAAILMDIELRGSDLNGIELTELVRGKRAKALLPSYAQGVSSQQTPVIFVTAHGTKYSDAFLGMVGGDKVISKPVDFGALNVALTQLHLSSAAQKKRRP